MIRVKQHKRTVEKVVGKRQGFRVLYRNNMYPREYVGMNYYAARELKIPFHHGKNTVVVWTGLSKKDRELTIQHEITEARAMSLLGLKYHNGHKVAQTFENVEDKII